jgi:hypothetical protein
MSVSLEGMVRPTQVIRGLLGWAELILTPTGRTWNILQKLGASKNRWWCLRAGDDHCFCVTAEAEMAGQPGFFDLSERYEALNAEGDPLDRLAGVDEFEVFRGPLVTVLRRSPSRQWWTPASIPC